VEFTILEGYQRCSFFLPRRESENKKIYNVFYLAHQY
jgi:hypothetical protein